jgi:hypothetical protein
MTNHFYSEKDKNIPVCYFKQLGFQNSYTPHTVTYFLKEKTNIIVSAHDRVLGTELLCSYNQMRGIPYLLSSND